MLYSYVTNNAQLNSNIVVKKHDFKDRSFIGKTLIFFM